MASGDDRHITMPPPPLDIAAVLAELGPPSPLVGVLSGRATRSEGSLPGSISGQILGIARLR